MNLRSSRLSVSRQKASKKCYRPVISWCGALKLYLEPAPQWFKMPSLESLPCVESVNPTDVSVTYGDHHFTATVTTAVLHTYMTWSMAEHVGLTKKILCEKVYAVRSTNGIKEVSVAETGTVALILSRDIKLITDVRIFPRGEGEEEICQIGRKTLADNNIIQKFNGASTVLYQQQHKIRTRSAKPKDCFLSAHFHPSLEDPPKAIFVCTGRDESFMCKKGMEAIPTFTCFCGVKSLKICMDGDNSVSTNVTYAPEIQSCYYTLGSKILHTTNAVVDYSGGYIYMKVKRKRYRIEMKSFADVYESSTTFGRSASMNNQQPKPGHKRKRDETDVGSEQKGREKLFRVESDTSNEQQESGHKRKRDETEVDSEEDGREKRFRVESDMSNEQQESGHKRKRDETKVDSEEDGREKRIRCEIGVSNEQQKSGHKRKREETEVDSEGDGGEKRIRCEIDVSNEQQQCTCKRKRDETEVDSEHDRREKRFRVESDR